MNFNIENEINLENLTKSVQVELEARRPRKKISFYGQILVKLRLW